MLSPEDASARMLTLTVVLLFFPKVPASPVPSAFLGQTLLGGPACPERLQ